MRNISIISLIGLAVLALCSGCATTLKYPSSPAGAWGPEVRRLGTVTADSGKWPLALNVPPPEATYYSALRAKASSQYGVPEEEIVLGEVTVNIMAEVVGTIRSWKATAEAGQKKMVATATKSPTDTLLELKRLLDAGAITQAEYDAKKKALLEKL